MGKPTEQRRDAKRIILVLMTLLTWHSGHCGRAASRPSAKELLLLTIFFNNRVAECLQWSSELHSVREVQGARARRVSACSCSVHVLEGHLARVYPYV